jgi:ATP-dependent exoDNAse (exonuclease V) alpha subunit
VREHAELDYASTAHRAQGRTVDTAHTMVSDHDAEALYVSATRGRDSNHLYSAPTTTLIQRPPTTGVVSR